MKGISIIIPVYNRQAFLEEAIKSVLKQNYEGQLEIIVSDDGSTDQSLQIASSFGEQVRIVLKPDKSKSQGVSGTRNRGIAVATQPYVAFLDSDDFYLPNHLIRMANVMESNQKLGFVFSRCLQMKEESGKRLFAPWTRNKLSKRDIRYLLVSNSNVVHTNTFLFKRSVFESVGVFNESYSNNEDGDMWMRVSECNEGAFLDHFGAVYRTKHGFSQLTSISVQQLSDSYQDVIADALDRCKSQSIKDRYRLFRLRRTLASFQKPRWLYLLAVALLHPINMAVAAVNLIRPVSSDCAVEYRNLDNYITL
jgi:glycosyltransferase involved in cell wall biosynthesis